MDDDYYKSFKSSACYTCGYCGQQNLREENANELEIRRYGIIKIWCYAVNDIINVSPQRNKETCCYKIRADKQ